MSSEHYPDRWVILDLNCVEDGLYKVLGSWSGGYLDGDSWRTSSGITSIKEEGDYLVITNHSGSVYRCHKRGEGMHTLASSIYSSLKDRADVKIVEDIPALVTALSQQGS